MRWMSKGKVVDGYGKGGEHTTLKQWKTSLSFKGKKYYNKSNIETQITLIPEIRKENFPRDR